VVVDEGGITPISYLLLLLDAGEIVDGFVGVAELESSEALPENIEGIVRTLVELSTSLLERLPELLPNQKEDCALTDLQLHLLVL